MVAGEDDHQVRNHRGLALGIELDEVRVGELGKRHLDEADRALDHRPASGEDRFGLLAAEHHLGDLGRVGEVGQPGLEDLDPGQLQPGLELGLKGVADLVELDTERKAAMVSNLMVVLSGDHSPSPVINTGTLYS